MRLCRASQSCAALTACYCSAVVVLWVILTAFLLDKAKGSAIRDPTWMLLEAAGRGDLATFERLTRRVSINTRGFSGWTPLHMAAMKNQYDMVAMLVEKRANLDAKDENGWTALHWAAHAGHFSIVKLLVKEKATIDARTHSGWTPGELSEDSHAEITEFLRESLARSRLKQSCSRAVKVN